MFSKATACGGDGHACASVDYIRAGGDRLELLRVYERIERLRALGLQLSRQR